MAGSAAQARPDRPVLQAVAPDDPSAPLSEAGRQGPQLSSCTPGLIEEEDESLSHRPLWQRWWYRAALERGSAARAEGGPHAGPRELAQLPRSDGPQRRRSRSNEARRRAAVR